MKFKIYDTELHLKNHYCQLNEQAKIPIEKPYVNLYVQSKGCNAHCSFCEYKDTAEAFDFDKFKTILSELNEQIEIRKISFTGGEPTLDFNAFSERLKFARETVKDTFIVVNTNGVHLEKIIENKLDLLLDSIALSRHSDIDSENDEIFGFKTLTTSALRNISSKIDLLHLSCNLIKGYINGKDKMIRYLEWCSDINVKDIGFVGLMHINPYAKTNFVSMPKIDTRLVKMKDWRNGNSCKCSNYLYIANNSNVLGVYHRHFIKKTKTNNILVFDGQNLRQGFGGNIIK